jgi:predicted transcriptional regulator
MERNPELGILPLPLNSFRSALALTLTVQFDYFHGRMAFDPVTLGTVISTLASNPTAIDIWKLLSKRPGMSGWELARRSDADIKKAREALEELKKLGVVKSDQPGLDGNYALTSLGFELKEPLEKINP